MIKEINLKELQKMLGNVMRKTDAVLRPQISTHRNQPTAIREAYHNTEFEDDGIDSPCLEESTSGSGAGQTDVSVANFSDDVQIDFIPSIDYRIICRFLGITSVNDIKNHPFSDCPLICCLLMESLIPYMRHKGFRFVGELNFDSNGNSIPPSKNPWFVNGKEVTFTVGGFLYFEKINGDKKENIVYFCFTDFERGGASITCYSASVIRSKDFIKGLKDFTKKNNCLRGVKLKDINLINASFTEVDVGEKYTWENFYFTDDVIKIFDEEVFSFLNNVEDYNKEGITKRGIIVHGVPGTGKTTAGKILCNSLRDRSVVWITPEILTENSYRVVSSIKSLYKLAEYLSPCVVILEDLDLISQDRDNGGDVLTLGSLMNVLDGINSIENCVTIATTNRLSTIEIALRNRPGRFDRIVEVPCLTDELRLKMFKNRLKDWDVNDKIFKDLIAQTSGWTGAEIQEFINGLKLKFVVNKSKDRILTSDLMESIIGRMNKFGIGEHSSFGFFKKD